VTIVVPAHNEAAALPSTVPALLAQCARAGWELIVVDDGSLDATAAVLAPFQERGELTLLRHKVRRGYGSAIKTGVQAARTELVATVDADGQHDLADVERLVRLLEETDADMAVGDRGSTSGHYREVGKWLIRRLARAVLPVPVRDINSGIKVYRADLGRRYAPLCPDAMAYSDIITLMFVHYGHRIVEAPVRIRPRVAGLSTISTRTAFETGMALLHVLMLFNPMRIFLPLSLVLVGAGFLWGLPIVLAGRGVSVGAMLSIVTGVILFALGLISEQLAMIRKASVRDRR
jgi:glycosyltransferase involved in cell wall biosynthesis